MTDDLEADLRAAFLTPATRRRPDLTDAILQRVRRDDRRRRVVITVSALVGAGIAGLAMVATGAADPAALEAALAFVARPTVTLALGLSLTALAAARHALREL